MSNNAMAVHYDYVIIGAGPAGLQLAHELEKGGHNYLVLEAGNSPGTFFKTFPRHRKLISNNKVYTGFSSPELNLRHDWNSLLSDNEELLFKRYSKHFFPPADEYVRYLNDFAMHYHLNIKYGARVTRVTKNGTFTILDSNGDAYTCKRLIVATGVSRQYVPAIPGIEYAELYSDVTLDCESFVNQRVLIIGKGNSAFETADHLIETAAIIHVLSPHPVKLAWKTHFVGDLRAVNNGILDTYQLKSQNLLLDANIDKIERREGRLVVSVSYTHANEEQEDLFYDRIIVCTGFSFDDAIFDETCRPKLTINNRFPHQTSAWESTNIEDLYFAGTLTQMRDYKKKTSGFIHGFRYNARTLYNILVHRYHGKELLSEEIDATEENMARTVIRRVNESSALWQQYGFLCDVLVVTEWGKRVHYYKDLPIDYVHDSELGKNDHYYTITLEFGLDRILASPDPFAIERIHKDDVNRAALSTGIHPILRRYAGSTLLCEHHIIEDIHSEWLEEVHVQPLLEFFQSQVLESIPQHQAV